MIMFGKEMEVEMDDDLLKEMDVVYLFDDREEKKRHIKMRMKVRFLQHHDDVWRKMVRQILVYNLVNQ